MSIANFIPEVWSSAIQVPYEKNLVYGQSSVASYGYSGSITAVGDTVKITSISAPTIRKYEKGTPLETEELSTTPTVVNIDQGDYFSFRVHDLDKAQAAGDFQGPATQMAGIELRDGADQFLAATLKDGALAANKLGTLQVVNDDPTKAGDGQTTAFKVLVQLSAKLNAQSVPTTGRYVVIGPETYAALLMEPRFTRVDASGTSEGLRNGIVGRAVGFDVLVSNNVPSTSGRELAIAGVADAFVFASQLLETEALRDPDHFGDKVRGLHAYGAAVTRPEGIATADLNIVSPASTPAGD